MKSACDYTCLTCDGNATICKLPNGLHRIKDV